MKILQLSTGHLGGAGLAARRLNDALSQAGIDSTFVALQNPSFRPALNELSIRRNPIQKLTGGFLAKVQRKLSDKTLFSPISMNSISLKKLKKIAEPTETILHIHNFQNLISEKSIRRFSKAGYRIVLTLHDQRFFTGGCHYSFDCKQYESGCTKCPLLSNVASTIPRIKLLRNPIQNISKDMLVVNAPSNWLISSASCSLVLQKFKKYKIDNLLGPQWLRKVNNLERSKLFSNTLGIASMDPSSYIKGGDIIQNLVESSSMKHIKFLFLKDIPKDRQFEDFWSVIDCLLVVSRADNSPNVIHEAKSLGIPIIASEVGGIPELLSEIDVCIPIDEITPRRIITSLSKFRSDKTLYEFSQNNLEHTYLKEERALSMYLQMYRELF